MLALDFSNAVTLRDYQERAVRRVKAEFEAGSKGVFLAAPTGSGKTQMFVHLINEWVAQGANCAITAHRGELLTQAAKTLASRGLQFGVIQAGDSTNPQAPIQLCSIDSMKARALPWKPDFIVPDEAHLAVAPKYLRFFEQYSDARFLPTSATPVRTDGKGFEDIADRLVVAETINGLLRHPQGPWLVPPVMYRGKDLGDRLDREVKTLRNGEYNTSSLEHFMSQPELVKNVVDEYLKRAAGRKGVVFCVDRKHSRLVCEQFNRAGIRAEHIDGEFGKRDREAVLRRLSTGETQIVTNAMLLCEGWDEWTISYVGLARPTKSLPLYLQQAGRVLRLNGKTWAESVANGKTDAVIIDHGQIRDRLGHVLDEREWSLKGSGRMTAERRAPKLCPRCEAMMPKGECRCRICGYEAPNVIDLTRLPWDPPAAKKPEAEHPLIIEYRKLLRWAKAKGKEESYSYFALEAKFGRANVASVINVNVSNRLIKEVYG